MTSDLLFDVPWWVLGLLVMVGAVLFVTGNRRQEKRVMCTGGILLLIALVWGAISYYVDTPLEQAVKRTRAIAQAVDQHDWSRLEALLDPETSVLRYRNRAEIISGGKATAERIGLKNVRIIGLEGTQNDSLITIDVNVLSDQDLFPTPATPTSWRFNYNNLGTGWRLTHVEALPNRVITPDVIRGQLSDPN